MYPPLGIKVSFLALAQVHELDSQCVKLCEREDMSNHYYYYFNNIIDNMNIRFSSPRVNEGRKISCPFPLLTKEQT